MEQPNTKSGSCVTHAEQPVTIKRRKLDAKGTQKAPGEHTSEPSNTASKNMPTHGFRKVEPFNTAQPPRVAESALSQSFGQHSDACTITSNTGTNMRKLPHASTGAIQISISQQSDPQNAQASPAISGQTNAPVKSMDISLPHSNVVDRDEISNSPISMSEATNNAPNQNLYWEAPTATKDWINKDYKNFSRSFNAAKSKGDVKKILHEARNERIVFMCEKAKQAGYKIDQERLAWFLGGGESRSSSPVVKVCEGDYIRISSTQANRFGIKLRKGQEFELREQIIEGRQCLVLVPLQ